MFEKLEALEKRYNELENLLAMPEVIADTYKYQKLAKEFSDLTTAAKKYSEYKNITAELGHIEHIITLKEDEELLKMAQEERLKLTQRLDTIRRELEEFLIGKDKDYDRPVIVEIRAGTGGLEASLFVGDLYRMYTKYAAKCGWRLEIMDSHPTEAGGFKEIILSLQGRDVYKRMRYESGIHRVQRVPVTEASGRIHTSAVTVAVLVEPEDVDITISPEDLEIDVYRSSGPGGQSVNTADSAVRIRHIPTGLVVTCQDERSQLKNKQKAMRVLRARLLDRMKQEQQKKISQDRKQQVGTGDRSEKIRTYNFPDRRVTDHRIGLTIHRLEQILDGELDEFIEALLEDERQAKLTGQRRITELGKEIS